MWVAKGLFSSYINSPGLFIFELLHEKQTYVMCKPLLYTVTKVMCKPLLYIVTNETNILIRFAISIVIL